jgi:hypothetical protein
MSQRYEQLTTPEAVIAAFEAGRRLEHMPQKCIRTGWLLVGPEAGPEQLSAWFSCGDIFRALIEEPESSADHPECSGDPASCPENEGYGCCKPNPKDASPIPEGFTPWAGGKCPEDARAKPTNVIRRDGACSANNGGPKPGACWIWSHTGYDSDIIAYRVESEPKPAEPNSSEPPKSSFSEAETGADDETLGEWVERMSQTMTGHDRKMLQQLHKASWNGRFISPDEKSPPRSHNGRGGDGGCAQPKPEPAPSDVEALTDREAFEAWVRSWCEKEDDARARLTWANGCYDNEEIQSRYVGFCAARRLRPQVDGAAVALAELDRSESIIAKSKKISQQNVIGMWGVRHLATIRAALTAALNPTTPEKKS